MKRVYLASPHMSEEGYEMEYVEQAFDTNWIAPLGPNVDGFEKEFQDLVGSPCALALASGTAAIHLALKASNVKKDDVVLVQSLTFAATVNPILYEHATPVFIDSDKDTWNMSVIDLEEALKKYPNAKAVIVVHLYGLIAHINEIVNLCTKYNVTLIEDAAESLGSTHEGKHPGTFGDFGIYSFNGNKIITTSGGGMLVSKHPKKIEKARFWATQSRDQARHYQHSEIGYNYRLSNVLAGIGRGQLKVLNKRVEKKNFIYNYYKTNLSGLKGIDFMPILENSKSNCWLTCMICEGNVKPIDVIMKLEEHNIEARPLWKPMHLQPVFKNYDFIGTGICEGLYNQGVCLPSDTKMSEETLKLICSLIVELYKENRSANNE
ncbi:Putative pyridoxal phosphate-dependent aminotransferase EpsN [Candidatus Izimaplasma bacterium HR1]|jgi:dTDP-4-amino-4,6-dideoxygalactose transaminase|uniref:DegT/DnrJ/EryC1/StrS family aminotransferase n=1 Tax=Candidatus Izimoplasma sp. HR1 TaxID=1541959 RepID=UPI0004F61A73|nr:Putative pyridoxal phosphate-dependent aminotransferase EpsN [Candidatus Izimaplasma bacterium HR1]